MIFADIDPSLCAAEPAQDTLDDGFSPPPSPAHADAPQPLAPAAGERGLGPQSPF